MPYASAWTSAPSIRPPEVRSRYCAAPTASDATRAKPLDRIVVPPRRADFSISRTRAPASAAAIAETAPAPP